MSAKPRREAPHAARSRARRRALQALYQWDLTGQEASDILRQFREEQDLGRVDVPHFEALVRGIIGDGAAIDALLGTVLDRPIDRVDPLERAVLRIGAWELRDHPEVPFKVVIDECVALASQFGTAQSSGYVNAVLDRLSGSCRSVEVAAGR